jgi:prophage DNA circulation protein
MITVLKGVGVALAVIAAGAAVAFIPIAIAVGASLAAFAALSLAIGYVVENVGAAKDAVVGWASSAYDAASQFVDGLVAGIKNGVASVIQAASDLASGAVDAVKGILQIQSPSRVMLEVGSNTARGMAAGIDEGAPDVADASRGLGVAAASGPAAIRRAGGAGRGGTKAPTIQITINGNVDEGVFNVLETRLAEVVERVVGRSGLLEPEPAGP